MIERGRVTANPGLKSLKQSRSRILSDASGNHSRFQSKGSEAQKTSSAPNRTDGELVTFWIGEDIIGHSGSGKTTLLEILAAFVFIILQILHFWLSNTYNEYYHFTFPYYVFNVFKVKFSENCEQYVDIMIIIRESKISSTCC